MNLYGITKFLSKASTRFQIGEDKDYHNSSAIPFNTQVSLEKAYELKVAKYLDIGKVVPYLIGAIISWHPDNEEIHQIFQIPKIIWKN